MTKRLRIPKTNHEEYLRQQGFKNIVGIDEVGRGALAGPLVAAAVKLPTKRLYQIRDSKLLLRKEREKIARKIVKAADCGIGQVSAKRISQIGLGAALQLVYQRALKNLKTKSGRMIKPSWILIDGFEIKNCLQPQKAIIKGDMTCLSIAAASVVAKTYRDRLMRQLGRKYWQYQFARNKGYGTREHLERLKKYRACKIHRTNFRPIREIK